MENPSKNDWVTCVVKDLENSNINLELIEIENMSEEQYKNICKEKITTMAFNYLISKKNNRQKICQAQYEYLEMAPYLQEDNLGYSVKEKHNLFLCRMNDLTLKKTEHGNTKI